MDVNLLYNPRSGSGKARALADRFGDQLARAGFRVIPRPTHDQTGSVRPPIAPDELRGSVLAVIGGDGTIHHAAPLAARAGAAIYHIPAGTENLFARHYGMTADPGVLIRSLRSPTFAPMDLGICNGREFALMASIGPDAGVIHRLHGTRSGPIRPSSYLAPILREFMEPHLPPLRVLVDGEPWLQAARGILVFGNSPHYAWNLNPARGALADDGLLDAVLYPCDTIADALGWAAMLLTRPGLTPSGAPRRQARRFTVTSLDGPAQLQMDGEVPANESPQNPVSVATRFELGVRHAALKVLLPFKAHT